MAIGHTRYSTTGTSNLRNAQPLTVDCTRGQIAIAHNGNLTNAAQLRDELENHGLVFQTSVDSEIIIMMLAQPSLNGVENTLVQTLRRIEGAYSLIIMTEKELIGARDPFGFRPLALGRVNGSWVLASESVALDQIQAEFVRDIEPGEIVIINEKGIVSLQAFPDHKRRAFCIFEYVYFARPDSNIGGRSVYDVRKEMGRQLAREHPVQADLVIPGTGQRRGCGARLFRAIRHPVRDGVHPQSLRRTQFPSAIATHPRLRRARKVESHRFAGEGQTRRHRG